MKSELCKSCAHTNVCGRDKNLVGDVFVMGNPAIFDNDELFRKYKEGEAAGFPCEDYMPERKTGQWIKTIDEYGETWMCSQCCEEWVVDDMDEFNQYAHYCPCCGAAMKGE